MDEKHIENDEVTRTRREEKGPDEQRRRRREENRRLLLTGKKNLKIASDTKYRTKDENK